MHLKAQSCQRQYIRVRFQQEFQIITNIIGHIQGLFAWFEGFGG
jgi:hypothetical protein